MSLLVQGAGINNFDHLRGKICDLPGMLFSLNPINYCAKTDDQILYYDNPKKWIQLVGFLAELTPTNKSVRGSI